MFVLISPLHFPPRCCSPLFITEHWPSFCCTSCIRGTISRASDWVMYSFFCNMEFWQLSE